MWRIKGSKLDSPRQSPSDQSLCWEVHSGPLRLPCVTSRAYSITSGCPERGKGSGSWDTLESPLAPP